MIETADKTHGSIPSAKANAHNEFRIRQLIDWLVCLAIAATLVRSFEVEGYIISTGSMAPTLLGYHKRVVCPACQFPFAYGVAADERPAAFATCPNCGRDAIDLTRVPANEGDQLLVHKDAFLFRQPRRWEVIVFHNPNKPTQAYVKRAVGLPGERVQIRNGDVYVNGAIQRKTLASQRGTRIVVFDNQFRPRDDTHWNPRWAAQTGWTRTADGFRFEAIGGKDRQDPNAAARVVYHHWIRQGGDHETWVPFDDWPAEASVPNAPFSALAYDAAAAGLSRSAGVAIARAAAGPNG